MTTDIVIRYAEDINQENEIANFQRYAIRGNSISAVSWELPGTPRRKGGEYLLKKMTERILLGTKTAMLHVMVELSATQPDNAIVNYKKTWGLLKARGVKVDEIFHKINFMKKNKDGLVLSGLGAVYISSEGVVSDLFNCNGKVYFAFFNSEVRCNEVFSADNLSDWMNNIWDENGVVFLLMGYLDEADSELVALARKSVLNIFFEVKK